MHHCSLLPAPFSTFIILKEKKPLSIEGEWPIRHFLCPWLTLKLTSLKTPYDSEPYFDAKTAWSALNIRHFRHMLLPPADHVGLKGYIIHTCMCHNVLTQWSNKLQGSHPFHPDLAPQLLQLIFAYSHCTMTIAILTPQPTSGALRHKAPHLTCGWIPFRWPRPGSLPVSGIRYILPEWGRRVSCSGQCASDNICC